MSQNTDSRAQVQIQGFGGIFFYATDAAALARWYAEVLDIETARYGKGWFVEWPSAPRFPGGGRIATVHLAIFQAEAAVAERKTARVALRVDDLDQTIALLEARGQAVRRKPEQDDYGRFAWVDDPEGNCIELWEPPAVKPDHIDA